MANDESEAYEEHNVHHVYEQIASHFSSTRYKPWPIVENFLRELPPGSIGLDAGCGNGKYLTVNRSIFMLASDRSSNLIKYAARHDPHDALVADALSLPHPLHLFDFAISIAAVHHFSTPERRVQAVRHLLDHVKDQSGKILIFVWALEQKNSRRGWDEGDEQDVLVPWVMKANAEAKIKGDAQDQTFHRYYHLYRQGELEEDIVRAGGSIVESGYERDNWWAIATRNR